MPDTSYCTLDELKDYMHVTQNDDDARLDEAIQDASRAIDGHCGRLFYDVTGVAAGTDNPEATARVYSARRSDKLLVDDFHTLDDLAVAVDTASTGTYGTTWTIGTDFVAKPADGVVDGLTGFPFWELHAVGSRCWPCGGGRDRIQVTAHWGWAAVPKPVFRACRLLAAELYKMWTAPLGITDQVGEFGALRVGRGVANRATSILGPYRRPETAVLMA